MFLNTEAIHSGPQRHISGNGPRQTPHPPLFISLNGGGEPAWGGWGGGNRFIRHLTQTASSRTSQLWSRWRFVRKWESLSSTAPHGYCYFSLHFNFIKTNDVVYSNATKTKQKKTEFGRFTECRFVCISEERLCQWQIRLLWCDIQ